VRDSGDPRDRALAYIRGRSIPNQFIVVDEAQNLSNALDEAQNLLSNLETAKSKLLQIILVGQPELKNTLSRPQFRQLKQRINLRFHIPPLTEEETRAYIGKRVTVAGGKEPLFTAEAVHEGNSPKKKSAVPLNRVNLT
jgi:general secretion pathway protein A